MFSYKYKGSIMQCPLRIEMRFKPIYRNYRLSADLDVVDMYRERSAHVACLSRSMPNLKQADLSALEMFFANIRAVDSLESFSRTVLPDSSLRSSSDICDDNGCTGRSHPVLLRKGCVVLTAL